MPGLKLPAKAEYEAAATRVRDVVVETPLVPFPGATDVWLKAETMQTSGCFKLRGIFHAVSQLSGDARAQGLSTVSAGNTAKALAWCGRHFGVPARSVMPEQAPRTKVDAFEAMGGVPVLVPVDEVFGFLREHRWEREPYAFIHPWTDRNVLLGHGSMAFEILAQLADVDTVFVPVGGGGLLGGVGGALKALRPDVRIVAVEPEGCPSLHAAVAAGHPVDVACATICDGVAVPYMTDEMFPLLRELADQTELVSEDAVREAIRALARSNHIVAEGSGALALAAALATPPEVRGRSVCLVTGGSIDLEKLASILGEG